MKIRFKYLSSAILIFTGILAEANSTCIKELIAFSTFKQLDTKAVHQSHRVVMQHLKDRADWPSFQDIEVARWAFAERKRKGLSQVDLAHAVNCSQKTISVFEKTGRGGADLLIEIIKVLLDEPKLISINAKKGFAAVPGKLQNIIDNIRVLNNFNLVDVDFTLFSSSDSFSLVTLYGLKLRREQNTLSNRNEVKIAFYSGDDMRFSETIGKFSIFLAGDKEAAIVFSSSDLPVKMEVHGLVEGNSLVVDLRTGKIQIKFSHGGSGA